MANLHKLECNFNNVSFGEKTASIGCKIAFTEITLAKAHKDLCEQRLKAKIIAKGHAGDNAKQGQFEGMEDDVEISGVFDTAGISCKKKTFTVTLSLNLNSTDRAMLSMCAQRNGHLVITGVDDIPEPEKPAPKKKDADGAGDDDADDEKE